MGKGAKVVALSHFGRPKGKRESSMSLRPIAKALEGLCGARSPLPRTASASPPARWSRPCPTAI